MGCPVGGGASPALFEVARTLLLRLKKNEVYPFVFLSDDHDISSLPRWVKTPKQTTDGHLVELARTHGAVLATLDEGIAGAYRIA